MSMKTTITVNTITNLRKVIQPKLAHSSKSSKARLNPNYLKKSAICVDYSDQSCRD